MLNFYKIRLFLNQLIDVFDMQSLSTGFTKEVFMNVDGLYSGYVDVQSLQPLKIETIDVLGMRNMSNTSGISVCNRLANRVTHLNELLKKIDDGAIGGLGWKDRILAIAACLGSALLVAGIAAWTFFLINLGCFSHIITGFEPAAGLGLLSFTIGSILLFGSSVSEAYKVFTTSPQVTRGNVEKELSEVAKKQIPQEYIDQIDQIEKNVDNRIMDLISKKDAKIRENELAKTFTKETHELNSEDYDKQIAVFQSALDDLKLFHSRIISAKQIKFFTILRPIART
jgi:hypothetical protein